MANLDQFENTAAWLEYCDGMSRFAAETEAARRQGFKRHEVMNEISKRNSARGGDHGAAHDRNATGAVSRVQPAPEKENRPMFERHVQAGWAGLVLLALQPFGWGVL